MKARVAPSLRPAALAVILVLVTPVLHAQSYKVLFNFFTVSCSPSNAANPGIIAQGRDGNLYTTTPSGGCNTGGAAFKITPGGALTVLHSFGSQTTDRGFPYSGLTLGTDGNFWGVAEGGGFVGNIFKMSPAGAVTNYNVLGGTSSVNGVAPYAPPVQGMDGNFYGATDAGGNLKLCTYVNGGCGVVYKITSAGKYSVLYTFDQVNGANPDGPLLLGTDGNFYGTASAGGTVSKTFRNEGVVFKITPAGKYSVIYAFCALANCADGATPYDGLVQGSDGNFYGTTTYGGLGTGGLREGVAFKVTPAGKLTVLYSFCNVAACKDGANPIGGLTLASDGNFYGTTKAGGSKGYGTLFQLTPAGKYTVLYNFDLTTGAYPEETLVQHTNGILYGDTFDGGTVNTKGVFHSLNLGLKPFVRMVNWFGRVGQTIEILGQGFTGTTDVSFNGTHAVFTVSSSTYLTAVVPAGTTPGLVTVTTPSGTLTSNRKFIVLPSVASFSPASATVGSLVVISGNSFTGATKVTFGGVAATIFTVNSDTEISATVPAGAKTGPIAVTTPTGTSTSTTNFLVTPQLTSFTPASGAVGATVTITGVSLTGATKITFGGVAATTFTVNSDTKITVTVPTGAVTGKIVVTTPGGTATSATNFTVT